MKFLVFNLAVAAALIFLFTADRGDVQKIAGKAHDAATGVKAYAKRTLDKGQQILDRGPATPAAIPLPIHQAVPAKPDSVKAPQKPQPLPIPRPTRHASKIAESTPSAPAVSAPSLTPNVAPAVAQRRQEILNGIPPEAPPVAATKLKEGTNLMTSVDRRKELLSLAEEMELLYARSISR